MQVVLKTAKARWDDVEKKRVVEYGSLPVDIDTSVFAHARWESHFQPTLNCTLADFILRIQPILHDSRQSTSQMLSLLKVLYCHLDSNQLPTFAAFLKMQEPEVFEDNLRILSEILKESTRALGKN